MRVAVVGGGVAGLAAVHRLRELGGDALDLVLLDRADRLGGKIRTGVMAGLPVEAGAETFLVREHGTESAVLELARRIGLAGALVHPAPVPAAIAADGALRPIPPGTLLGVPSDPSRLDGLAAPGGSDVDTGEPVLSTEDIGVGTLVRRRFGDQVVDRLVDPMLGGVYAGRADELSLATTMPGLYETARREHTLAAAVRAALAAAPRPAGSPVFASVHGGLSRFVDALTRAAGARVRLGATVRGLTPSGSGWRLLIGSTRDAEELAADAVVLAVPAIPAARLLDRPEIAGLAYASVALVTLAYPAGTRLPELSGFLVPATEGYAVKAATFFSTKWPHLRGPRHPVLVRTSIGRHGEAEVLQRTDEDLAALAHAELGPLTGAALPAPLTSAVQRWGGALPQYAVGHLDRVRALRSQLPATVAIAGAAVDGVGIAACVRSGQAAADSIWQGLGE